MAEEETRTLMVFGYKTFQIKVPKSAKITFAPFSPPGKHGYANDPGKAQGTIRIYEGAAQTTPIIGVFSGVTGFRDMSLDYMEEVAKEEGATIWKHDDKGYMRESKVSGSREWSVPEVPALEEGEGASIPF